MSNKEWTPEEGDLIEVSDDGKNWEDDKRIFLAVVPRVELPVIVVSLGEEERYNDSDIEWALTSNSFRYMRPIKEDLTEAEANEEIRKILSRIKK